MIIVSERERRMYCEHLFLRVSFVQVLSVRLIFHCHDYPRPDNCLKLKWWHLYHVHKQVNPCMYSEISRFKSVSVIQASHLVSSWTSASALLRTLSVVVTCHVHLDVSTITSSHTLKSRSHVVHSMSWDVQKWTYSVRNITTGMSHKEVRVSFTRTGRWVERVTDSSSGCTFTSTGSTWLSSSSSHSLPFLPLPVSPFSLLKEGGP